MSTTRYWRWIVLAFTLGAVVGFVVGVGTILVVGVIVRARIDYAG